MGRCTRFNRGGFTLIELLVVIAVIALLISILLPSLASGRETARQLKCSTNLRSMSTATMLYAGDYKGFVVHPNWRLNFDRVIGWLYAVPEPTAWVWETHRTGGLWPYLEADAVFRCPSHVGNFTGSERTTSYLMNGAVVGFPSSINNVKHFVIDRFRPDAIVFWEANSDGWNDGSSYPTEGIRARHALGAVVSGFDGASSFLTRAKYDTELQHGPSRLWCVPDHPTGGR